MGEKAGGATAEPPVAALSKLQSPSKMATPGKKLDSDNNATERTRSLILSEMAMDKRRTRRRQILEARERAREDVRMQGGGRRVLAKISCQPRSNGGDGVTVEYSVHIVIDVVLDESEGIL